MSGCDVMRGGSETGVLGASRLLVPNSPDFPRFSGGCLMELGFFAPSL